MNWLSKIIRKFFLVKEIKSKDGYIHFRRYRLLEMPWFAIYIHNILKSDEDRHFHDHPFNFTSVILSGAYKEEFITTLNLETININEYFAGDVIKHDANDAHKITLLSKEVWTLVLITNRSDHWGYRLKEGVWVDHKEYRELKKIIERTDYVRN